MGTDSDSMTLEEALARTERDVDAALKAAAAAARELKKARTSAKSGEVKAMRRALDAAHQLARQLSDVARAACDGWTFDEDAYLHSGRYTAELIERARQEGVSLHEQDDKLLAYPSLVRVLPSDAAIEVDKRRERRIRPSVIAALLKARQSRPPRSRPEPFLEALLAAYEIQVKAERREMGATVKLTDIYRTFTLLPGQARDYSKQEFARDLYLLDQSGLSQTKAGLRLRLSASTLTKTGGGLATVTRDGQTRTYAGIAFE